MRYRVTLDDGRTMIVKATSSGSAMWGAEVAAPTNHVVRVDRIVEVAR